MEVHTEGVGVKSAVLKFGGEVVADPVALAEVLADVARLVDAGWRFVICHGGGPQATALGQALGLEAVKVAGQRVTDAATLEVVSQAIAGQASTTVVAAALEAGVRAVGVSAGVVQATRRPPVEVEGRTVDYGFVGDITAIDTELLRGLWALGRTPVVNPVAVWTGEATGPARGRLNVNGDTVAAAIAVELGVDHLFAMTAVGGVLRDRHDPSTRIAVLDEPKAREAIAAGVIAGGMIPKVEEALVALSRGVGAVHILGAKAGLLLAEAEQPGRVGTALRAE